MQTKSIHVETIISGFSHLVWLSLLAILILDIDKSDLVTLRTSISVITVGAAAFLASGILGASYFLGMLTNRILVDLLSLVKTESDFRAIKQARENKPQTTLTYDLSWITKMFFLSMSAAGFLIILFSICLVHKYFSSKECLVILIIGIPTEIATITAFFTQREAYRREREQLLRKSF